MEYISLGQNLLMAYFNKFVIFPLMSVLLLGIIIFYILTLFILLIFISYTYGQYGLKWSYTFCTSVWSVNLINLCKQIMQLPSHTSTTFWLSIRKWRKQDGSNKEGRWRTGGEKNVVRSSEEEECYGPLMWVKSASVLQSSFTPKIHLNTFGKSPKKGRQCSEILIHTRNKCPIL